jgi:Protein of unknown function (DUF3991)/Toprim-like
MNWRQRADQLRAVPLTEVLRCCGAHPDPYDRDKWHTQRGVLTVTGAKFINWNSGRGGGGAIDLVMHLRELGFGQALHWLDKHFAAAAILPVTSPTRQSLSLPPPCSQRLEQVRRYLVEERRLPPRLLEPLFQSGDLYADARANAVFLLRANDGQAVGAELRGTASCPWRGMAPGSRKDHGFFAVPNASLDGILLCESAIDAISAHALHPEHRCVSTAGARPNPAWLQEMLIQSHRLYCGFDLDDTGESMARNMITLHPSIQRLRPPLKDWNATLQSTSSPA